jgi:alpha-glucosidase
MAGRGRRYALAFGLALASCTFAVGGSLAAQIGNVTSFSTSGQDITFSISDGSKVRVTILAADTARVRIAPSGTFTTNVSRAVVKNSWVPAVFSATDGGSSVTLSTGSMNLIVQKSPFVLECRDVSNNLVLTDDPTRRIQWDSGSTQVYKTTQSNEKYLGLGWRTQNLVRNGTRFVMRNVPSYGTSDTFYSGVPLWYGLRNGTAYGIFFDDTSWGTIDMTTAASGYMSFKNLGGMVDYYYFAGPSFAAVLDRYTQLTGRPFMPPRWAVGYQQSRWSYTPQSQVLSIANEFRTRNIPCDAIYLDIDYMPGGVALTFDPAKFPSPATMLSILHGQGFHVVANISPFLFIDDPKRPTAESNGYFLKKADGSVLWGWHDYWYFVGGATHGNLAWLDFTKTAVRNWWTSQHSPFLALGIDAIWNDLNEPDELGGAWPTDVKYDFDGNPVNHNRTSTQYSLIQTDLSYSILSSQYPTRRPFVLSRGGYAGIQRSSSLWSGDNTSDWTNDFKRNIPMGLSMSLSGNPCNGHDIGGFTGYPNLNDAPSPELYARWMEAGIFNPFCRQHHDGWGNHDPNRPFTEPWRFGTTVEGICRDFIGLRYRLMPYLYTLFHNAHTAGEPIQRPTLYDFPGDSATLTQNYDFMVGPDLLVSPVTTQGAATWNTYLPAGADWINWWDDTLRSGGQTVATSTPLERIPIYVRSGAIIPMAPVSQYDGQGTLDRLTLEMYPADQPGMFTLYEDDGLSWDYLSGGYCKTAYTMSGTGDSFTLDIAAREGSFAPAARGYLLKVHRWPGHTRTACLDGAALAEYADRPTFDAAASGSYLDTAAAIFYAKFHDSGSAMSFTFCAAGYLHIPGDVDRDDDVDQTDFGSFQACLSGAGVTQADPACAGTHLDADTDVDEADLAIFLQCMTGPGITGDPACAQ